MQAIQTAEVVESEYLTTAEVSRMTRISQETLRYWRTVDVGPVSFKFGRRVFYRRSEVERWFAEQEAATRRGGAA